MKRRAGVLMHLSSLWGDYREGAFGKQALAFLDHLKQGGFSVWQVLPFCLPDEYHSPYKSYSTFSINPYFIDLESLYQEGFLTKEELSAERQSTPYQCEFSALSKTRLPLLAKAAERFYETGDVDSLENFFEHHPHTAEFCLFMARKEKNQTADWTAWQTDSYEEGTLRTWRFTQYIAYTQWKKIKEYANQNGILIIGDLPIYVAWDSADVCAAPHLFCLDQRNRPTAVAGVPPDYFCAEGQLWGNPLYRWSEMKKDGYAWWQARMQFACELFDGVRIDHFRGLESYYTIPASAQNAKKGTWKKGPGMQLIRALQAVCPQKMLIAEDLGEITPAVEKLVKQSTFPGMRVLQFGLADGPQSIHLPHNYENHCIAYTGTHDNNTLLGYVWELDEVSRNRFLQYFGYHGDWDDCYQTVLRSMLASHAGWVIFPIQDLLQYGKDTRLNTPGNAEENWGFRLTKEQIDQIDWNTFATWNTLYARDL